MHTDAAPDAVSVGATALRPVSSTETLKAADSGFHFDSATGVVHVKTPSVATGSATTVRITGSGAVGGSHPEERDVSLDLSAPRISVAGEASTVKASFTNRTGKPVDVTATSLTAPEGWSVQPTGSTTTTALKDGGTFAATFAVTPPPGTKAGSQDLAATTAYTTRELSRTVTDRASTTVAFANLAAAFNNVGVTRSADPAPGNIDGGGSSFLAERRREGASRRVPR